MRQAGLILSNVVLHALFVTATVCLLLALLVAAGHVVVWRGLDFPVGLRQAGQFGGWALVGYGAGWLIYAGLRGLFPAERSGGGKRTV